MQLVFYSLYMCVYFILTRVVETLQKLTQLFHFSSPYVPILPKHLGGQELAFHACLCTHFDNFLNFQAWWIHSHCVLTGHRE